MAFACLAAAAAADMRAEGSTPQELDQGVDVFWGELCSASSDTGVSPLKNPTVREISIFKSPTFGANMHSNLLDADITSETFSSYNVCVMLSFWDSGSEHAQWLSILCGGNCFVYTQSRSLL